MITYLSILFLVLLANIYAITLCINIRGRILRFIYLTLLAICMFRYFSLYAFLEAEAPTNLYLLKNIVLSSFVSIPIVSYISLRLLNKCSFNSVHKVFISILTALFLFVIYKAPYGIASSDIGYIVTFKNNWQFIILIIQCAFSALMIYLSLNYIIKSNNIKHRIINLIFLIGYIGAIVEPLSIFFNKGILPTTVISEGVILISIILTLKIKPNS